MPASALICILACPCSSGCSVQAWTEAYHEPAVPELYSAFQRAGSMQQAIVMEVC